MAEIRAQKRHEQDQEKIERLEDSQNKLRREVAIAQGLFEPDSSSSGVSGRNQQLNLQLKCPRQKPTQLQYDQMNAMERREVAKERLMKVLRCEFNSKEARAILSHR